jgi:hypothetical protein
VSKHWPHPLVLPSAKHHWHGRCGSSNTFPTRPEAYGRLETGGEPGSHTLRSAFTTPTSAGRVSMLQCGGSRYAILSLAIICSAPGGFPRCLCRTCAPFGGHANSSAADENSLARNIANRLHVLQIPVSQPVYSRKRKMNFPLLIKTCRQKGVRYWLQGRGFGKASWRNLANFALNRIEQKFGRSYLLSNPSAVQIEPTTACNLNCHFCGRQSAWSALRENVSYLRN